LAGEEPGTAGFNPRARVGRDSDRQNNCRQYPVSIHAPAWGATQSVEAASGGRQFQSTRPRGARLRHGQGVLHGQGVSIHAPAWGATGHEFALNARQKVSIHAPAWGATAIGKNAPPWAALFQSTRPRGARLACRIYRPACLPVSIHAPAWGATGTLVKCSPCSNVSIHAPAWGATYTVQLVLQRYAVSIHAPAWGATKHPP